MSAGSTSARDAVLTLGRYTLCGEIAAGGMAAVYFARMEGTGGFAKSVAVKRLHPQFASDPDFRTMILDEARLAARIRHPNVVSPIDVMELEDEVLLAMEYVHGQALARLIRVSDQQGETIPLAICASVMVGMLHGLHAAHEAKDDRGRPLNIVHRDISPHNVIVGADGVTRVIDFGIAKAKTSSEATQAGMVKGKVPYLAPEQLHGLQATVETDIYAASLVFWEALVGQRLFDADYDHEIVGLILRGKVDPPSAHVPCPPEVDAIVLRGLAREPSQRFRTAREMALAIEQVVQLANPSVVGGWVERLAEKDLAKRAAKLARLEALPSIPADELAMSLSSSRRQIDLSEALSVSTATQRNLGPPPPTPRAPPPPPSFASFGASPPSTRPPPAPTPPPPRPPPPSARVVPATLPSLPDAPRPPPPGALRGPDIQMANVGWLPPNVATGEVFAVRERPRRIGGGLFAVAFLLLGLAALALFLPRLLRDSYVKQAASKGVTLAIGRVSLSSTGITLEDVEGSVQDLPGATFKAPVVVLGMRGVDANTVTIDKLEVGLQGGYEDLDRAFDQWMKTKVTAGGEPPGGRFAKVTIRDAKVLWAAPLGPGMRASFENVSGAFTAEPESLWPNHYAFVAGIVKVANDANDKVFGPYELKVSRELDDRAYTLRLDPYGSTGAEVGMNTHGDIKRLISFRIPKRTLAEHHVPEALFGGLATKETRLEVTGELTVERGDKPRAEGKLTLGASALRIGVGGAPLDAELTAALGRAGEGVLDVTQGSLLLGPTRGKATGAIDSRGKGVRVEITSKRCDVASEGPGGTTRLALSSADVTGGSLFFAPCIVAPKKR
ncbi:MAG: serine/threonine protein kinase [Myxococcales bacterium]|nr:serine/threonine protein kinase [Myxococcales bacterium]